MGSDLIQEAAWGVSDAPELTISIVTGETILLAEKDIASEARCLSFAFPEIHGRGDYLYVSAGC